MAIVTISRGTFSGGKKLAECVSEKLGYRCLARNELAEAARRYGVSEEKLSKAIGEAPHFWERFTAERTRYLACARAALVSEVRDSNSVYHGLAGHFLLQGVPQVLRVRVVADMEFRIKAAMERGALSRENAIHVIRTMDEKRAKWVKFLYHVDWSNPSLYDLVINLDKISLASACELVCCAVSLDEYQPSPQWHTTMNDMTLSTHIRALLAADENIGDTGIDVNSDHGLVTISGIVEWTEDIARIEELVAKVPEVRHVKIDVRLRSSPGEVEGLRIR